MPPNSSSDSFLRVVSRSNCSECADSFELTEWERGFLKKVDLPEPKRCPRCRSRRRLLHLNQLNLTKRVCSATGKGIISHFSENVRHPVYDVAYWHSDAFDGRSYGREVDFSRGFFEQIEELKNVVPYPALHVDYLKNENSLYVNYAGAQKNCYFTFNAGNNFDCLYGYGLEDARSSMDCMRVQRSELCYETVDCVNCYQCAFLSQSENCSDSYLLHNCIGCRNCFMCVNLRQKEFYLRNQPVAPEVYHALVRKLTSCAEIEILRSEMSEFRKTFPERCIHGVRIEDVSGNYLVECRNAYNCFDSHDLWDAMYASQSFATSRDLFDCDECGEGELISSSANSGGGSNLRGCFASYSQVQDLDYCIYCVNGCAHLFGCVGLKRNEYCILNKQYQRAEYEELVPKIVAHMKGTGEWGEFFPPKLSDFPYNLSQAQMHHPLTREQALRLGFRWEDEVELQALTDKRTAPAELSETSDMIIKESIACRACGRGYRIQKLELVLHRQMGIALPRECFLCRHRARQQSRTRRQIFDRACDHCAAAIQSAYPPNYAQPVYCEACFAAAAD